MGSAWEDLVVWFTPDAIRDTFDGTPDDGSPKSERARWVAMASDDVLRDVGALAADSDIIWEAFHEAVNAAVSRAMRDV